MTKEQIAERARINYEAGFWPKSRLRALVEKGVLTKTAYKNIVGEKY